MIKFCLNNSLLCIDEFPNHSFYFLHFSISVHLTSPYNVADVMVELQVENMRLGVINQLCVKYIKNKRHSRLPVYIKPVSDINKGGHVVNLGLN